MISFYLKLWIVFERRKIFCVLFEIQLSSEYVISIAD